MGEFMVRFPLLGLGAIGFICLLLACAVPSIRLYLSPKFEIPLPSTKQHLLPLDSYRGIAALWVALYHGYQWTYPTFATIQYDFPVLTVGHYGVQIFVVLSGMLIYRSLRNVHTVEGLRSYFWRRLLRICPLYVAVSLLFIVLFSPKFSAAIAELFLFRTVGYPNFMNPVAWSVYVEILFYLIMPAFVFLAYKRPAIAAVTVFLILMCGERGAGREFALWKFFFLGVICSELIDRVHTADQQGAQNRWGWGLFVLGLSAATFGIVSAFRTGLLGYAEKELAVGIGMALAICGSVLAPSIRTWVSIRPLRILGTISYSIYMLHPLLLITSFRLRFSQDGLQIISRGYEPLQTSTATFFTVYLPALLFFSCCSYLAVERPMLRLRSKQKTVATKFSTTPEVNIQQPST
jgi:Predicted acyltransferases